MKQQGLTLKSVVIGLILVLVNAYWVAVGSELWNTLQVTIASLFFNAVFTLFVLSLLNLLFQKVFPKVALSQAEMLVIYVMVVMLSTISGHTMMGYLMGALAHPFWFATPENEWSELFLGNIPSWLTVSDKNVLKGYFEGESSLYLAQNLKAWLTPVLVWSGIIIALWFVLMYINVLLRKQWTEHERLAYPIVQLPLEMTSAPKVFFKNRWLWLGFAIAGGIDLINGLNFLYPSIPSIPVRIHQIGHLFREKPWNAIGSWTHVSFYPFIIGLAFFMPLDLSFSCWFFYVFGKAQAVFANAMGWRGIYYFEQSIGAWIGIGIAALWAGRGYFRPNFSLFHSVSFDQTFLFKRKVWKKSLIKRKEKFLKMFVNKNEADDPNEPISYRVAGIGIVSGLVFLTLLCLKAGMSLLIIGLFFAIYLVMAIGITRVRAELGSPDHTIIYTDPGRTLVTALGTRRLGTANMTIISFFYPLNRCNRAHPMLSQLEAFKLSERSSMNNRQMMFAMMLAIVVSIIATFWIYLHIMYQNGAAAKSRGYIVGIGWETYNRLQSWLTYPRETDYTAMGFIGLGFAFTIFLMAMKLRFIWWPFHPAGYVLTTGEGMVYSWFAVFISWALKFAILKHGGVRGYRKAVPFFLGLILGEYVVACSWSILGIILKIPTYRAWV
jgi:hypothetical protein